jgi:tetratricopeptide (TPR) repeat protein
MASSRQERAKALSASSTVTRLASGSEAGEPVLERVLAEMASRWRQGERPLAEEYLARYPELGQQREVALELIYEEICLRQEAGQETAAAEVALRFPQWEEELQILVECQQLLAGPTAPGFPVAGESLGDFCLLAELGRGAEGRVFLATQPSLADRPVVVKLVSRDGREHLSLARLQHTHIVPLFSVQDYPSRNLRALCMPYFGGATLSRVLEALRDRPPAKRTGQHLIEVLGQAQSATASPVLAAAAAHQFLAGYSYADAICWIGACLADALHYAWQRSLIHLDVKPSNVLLTAEGQPMLLDFHLARAPIPAGAPAPDWLGGTPAYMAPEQRAALTAVREGGQVPVAVDGRADIYALGLVLYEALGGTLPVPPRRPAAALRRQNPEVSVAVADLVAKCLARDPQDRYATAAAVGADLRRHLADLPLRGVHNRSLAERWRKWRRRRPSALPLLVLLVSLLGAGALAVGHRSQQLHQARAALSEGRELLQRSQVGEALSAFRHGLALIQDMPWDGELLNALRDHLRQAERVQAVRELHELVERIRPHYGAALAPAEARVLETQSRRLWEMRDQIAQRLGLPGPPGLDQQVQIDLLDLAVLWTDLWVRQAPEPEAAANRREALKVLAEAEALFGPSCVLEQERHAHAQALGLPEEVRDPGRAASLPSPRSAWEHYALGRACLRAGDLARAASLFGTALELEPQGLWPNFYWGSCAYQQARYDDAVLAFHACVVLAPDRAWCFYNRGLAYVELGQHDRALHDFDRALQLDPTLAAAAASRAQLREQEQREP